MGLFDSLTRALPEFELPLSENLINEHLAPLRFDDIEGVDAVHSLRVELLENSFFLHGVVERGGRSYRYKLDLEIERFRVDFSAEHDQELVVRQRGEAQISTEGGLRSMVVRTMREVLKLASGQDLPQWALGKVDGIRVEGDRYHFDLVKLGAREKLMENAIHWIGSEHPLLRLAVEKALHLYCIDGAVCRQGELRLKLRPAGEGASVGEASNPAQEAGQVV